MNHPQNEALAETLSAMAKTFETASFICTPYHLEPSSKTKARVNLESNRINAAEKTKHST